MKTQMAHWISAGATAVALTLGACGDDGPRREDETDTTDGGGDGGTDADGGTRFRDRDAQIAASMDGTVQGNAGDGSSPGQSEAGAGGEGGAGGDGGKGNNPQADGSATADTGAGSDGGPAGEGGAQNPNGDCAAKAKEECEYQKKCDPVDFALLWDDDINQFCIPKRKAACEKGLAVSNARAISEGCHTWVRASCDNYRNFVHPVRDSNGKWQYGDAACEVTARYPRENRALNEDCTSDYQCKEGLFCRTDNDNYEKHDTNVESICGKCATQFAYEGPNTKDGFDLDFDVCFRQEQCKTGYQCLYVYGTVDGDFVPFDRPSGFGDLKHCVKTITKVGRDKPCAKDSNVTCEDGLICKGDSAAAIVGTCVPPEGATIPTYVGKDAACDPALCDPRLHLECKPVKTASGATEPRCVQTAVAAIGGFCKNDKKEDIASCSQYARCVESTGLCVRRNIENEACFPTSATPSQYDQGSCDPAFPPEKQLVCRQDSGELAPKCHQALPQSMCSLPR